MSRKKFIIIFNTWIGITSIWAKDHSNWQCSYEQPDKRSSRFKVQGSKLQGLEIRRPGCRTAAGGWIGQFGWTRNWRGSRKDSDKRVVNSSVSREYRVKRL